MIRIHVICEGQTEELFVNEVLSRAVAKKNIFLHPSLIGKPGHKGGNFKYERLLRDAKNRLLGDTEAYCTTFFDFYGLPEDFPGKAEAESESDFSGKADRLLSILIERLRYDIGSEAVRRFIPYVQMYEFEGLLFSEPEKLASGLGRDDLTKSFSEIRGKFPTPEAINNSQMTAPSKRILRLMPNYEKPINGSLAALEIGIEAMRRECSRFNQWVIKLEDLAISI